MNRLQHVGAFVLQFHQESILGTGRFSGRLEHVSSGRTAVFHSRTEMLRVLRQMVNDVRATVRDESQTLV